MLARGDELAVVAERHDRPNTASELRAVRDNDVRLGALDPAQAAGEFVKVVGRRDKAVHARHLNAAVGVELLHPSDAAHEFVLDVHGAEGESVGL